MKLLSEEIAKRRQHHWKDRGMYVRRFTHEHKKDVYRQPYLRVYFGHDVLVKADIVEINRIDARMENDSIEFFEAEANQGWKATRPGGRKSCYLNIPYKEGIPFCLNDEVKHELDVRATDSERHTITVSRNIADAMLTAQEGT